LVWVGGELVALLKRRPLTAPAFIWPDLEIVREKLDALRLDQGPEEDLLRIKVERVVRLVQDLLNAGDDRESVLASAAGQLGANFNVGRADLWGGQEQIKVVKETASEISTKLNETLANCRREALADVMPLIVRFVEMEAESRGRDGELTFDDLILRARDLLAADAGAVESFQARYDALLIDEFQDTDPLQVDIALAFAREPGSDHLRPGKLFLVGDPKQSIYRFRRADMGIYSATRSLIEAAGGESPVLSRNRRSRAELLAWVNHVFSRVIGAGTDPAVQPPYREIYDERSTPLKGPGVGYFGEAIGDKTYARVIRGMEARDAAALCRDAIAEDWQVCDQATGEVRDAQYRDIALLMPSRNILVPLERALADAGVPYRVEGGSLVYRTQEVRDLINCLTAIDDPSDEIAIVAALRSPAFACSDVELAQHRAAGGRWDYSRPKEVGEPRVMASLAALAEYHKRRHDTSLATLVEGFVADRFLVETGVLDQGDRNTFRRMRFVVEQARLFEAAGPESLREFVQWLERRGGREILDNEGAGLDDDEDSVRILTIHGAKGLEFPIVFMVGMGTQPNERPRSAYLADHTRQEVAVSIGAKTQYRLFRLGDWDGLESQEALHVNAEFARLLYVAATRARDHLVFSLYRKGDGAKTAAGILEYNGATDFAVRLTPGAAASGVRTSPLDGLEVDQPVHASVGELESERLALVAAGRSKRYTSATAEVRETAEKASEKQDEGDSGEPWARGRGGTRLGRAVHAAIQSLPLDAGADLVQAFSHAQAVAEAIPHRASDVARLVTRALASDAASRARSARRAFREVPFAVQSGDVTLEGFADMVIEDGGLEVVDWKTDQVSNSEVESRLAEYRLQAGLYVWGLETATGMPVTRITYVFASLGRELSPGDPHELSEAARRHLAGTTAPLR
jgi:ATP-dependent helicase/nuclease subunit A